MLRHRKPYIVVVSSVSITARPFSDDNRARTVVVNARTRYNCIPEVFVSPVFIYFRFFFFFRFFLFVTSVICKRLCVTCVCDVQQETNIRTRNTAVKRRFYREHAKHHYIVHDSRGERFLCFRILILAVT